MKINLAILHGAMYFLMVVAQIDIEWLLVRKVGVRSPFPEVYMSIALSVPLV